MHQKNKKPEPTRVSGCKSNSTPAYFPTPASISQRYGTGWPAYEAAKADWARANTAAVPGDYCAAMQRIARAVRCSMKCNAKITGSTNIFLFAYVATAGCSEVPEGACE